MSLTIRHLRLPAYRRRPLAFYRSIFMRRVFIATGLFGAWSAAFSPAQWHNTPSLRLIAHLGLPWPVLSIPLALYVALLTWGQPLAVELADWLGLWMYLVLVISVAVTIRSDRPFNPFVFALALVGTAAHLHAARLAHYDRRGM